MKPIFAIYLLLSLVALLIVLFVLWRVQQMSAKKYHPLTDAEVRRLYHAALRSHDLIFIRSVRHVVGLNWGDGKEYHRLTKHLYQGALGFRPGPTVTESEFLPDLALLYSHLEGKVAPADLDEYEE